MTDRPSPRLVDLLRDREDEIAPLIARIVDVTLDKDHAPADVQMAGLAAAATVIALTSPTARHRHRAREAGDIVERLVRHYADRAVKEGHDIDVSIRQGMHEEGYLHGFAEALKALIAKQPIPKKFLDAGTQGADHFREILLSAALQDGFNKLYADALGEQAIDYAIAQMATVHTAATVCGGLFSHAKGEDEATYIDLLVDMFRDCLGSTIAYWRKKGAN